MSSHIKALAPQLFAAFLALTAISCMAVSRAVFPPTPTVPPSLTPTFTVTPSPTPTPTPTITPTPDFCPNGDCISACLKELPAVAETKIMSNSGLKTGRRNKNSDGYGVEMLVRFIVRGDKILDPYLMPGVPKGLVPYQDDRATQRKIWDYFAAIIPPDQRRLLSEYNIVTDGKQNILAAVAQSDSDIDRWSLLVDIQDASNPQDLTYTLVHEFGHLLSLNDTQVEPSRRVFDNPDSEVICQQEVNACSTYFADVGCSLPDSYINQFYERFWPDIYQDWQDRVDDNRGERDYYSKLQDFYGQYQDQFVSDYAPTSPLEDFAESFTFFILKPRPEMSTIADEKVLFFYENPELVQLRAQIARRLCNQLKK